MAFDVERIRGEFPALARKEVFLDNPGGTQAVRDCLDRMREYLVESNANHDGAFATSRVSDGMIARTRAAMADFLNAAGPEEIIFGANMTTLTFHLSRSIGRLLGPQDRIAVTRLDHDANISPWLLMAEDRGRTVDWVDFHPEDGTLDLDSLDKALERNPRLVAVGYASNALGTINPIPEITSRAHRAGALVFVDAVHYAPHGPIDVASAGCDFLACSAYKFFGPHMGILYGRRDILDGLFPYKVRPSSNKLPFRFETGTLNHEAIAGLLGTLEYLERVGVEFGGEAGDSPAEAGPDRRRIFKRALSAIRNYERGLSLALARAIQSVSGTRIYGITDPRRFDDRAPTFAFRMEGITPKAVATELDKAGFFVWDGNYYALEVTRRLGVEEQGGMVRVGAVHYNTPDEIARFGEALAAIHR